jgi:hypothetical protein
MDGMVSKGLWLLTCLQTDTRLITGARLSSLAVRQELVSLCLLTI